jgi:hypothetical protein
MYLTAKTIPLVQKIKLRSAYPVDAALTEIVINEILFNPKVGEMIMWNFITEAIKFLMQINCTLANRNSKWCYKFSKITI